MLELLTHACDAGASACTVGGTSGDDICGFAQCDEQTNTAAVEEYCRLQGGPLNTVTTLCQG